LAEVSDTLQDASDGQIDREMPHIATTGAPSDGNVAPLLLFEHLLLFHLL
jgi:hypothetical protein